MPDANGFSSADYKVTGGKLLRVRLRTVPDAQGEPCIAAVSITGDFFMHPEEALEALEAALPGVPLRADVLRERIAPFFAGEVQVVGADVDDFVQLLLAAKP
ncbi:MAG TPA: lipoate protein ligase C-terminal domain-containing protein [Anaerolineae bacterium]|nr:biotin--protein ligase [Anaerolineae bacterium]HPD41339.1 lipoate protein ligase C-terminal domain-containing protein [Anaerolineae bacterium]HRT31942.1 lipoate protein ligase C-terminal domain-containing protein [Anaerolineae bacterium]HUM37615.1 lipoate protein ligase C-terminal domain-containing protein [Anaerolineae bacterium]HXK43378.1 lipoate protein ligase C-terminal domain-containing protein [Anaerolineae bacterium]